MVVGRTVVLLRMAATVELAELVVLVSNVVVGRTVVLLLMAVELAELAVFSLPTNGAASAKAVMLIKSRKPKFNCKGDHISKSGYKGLGWQGWGGGTSEVG